MLVALLRVRTCSEAPRVTLSHCYTDKLWDGFRRWVLGENCSLKNIGTFHYRNM